LEGQLRDVWIEGEISNYRKQSSGHHYFTLKDDRAQLACVMFSRAYSAQAGTILRDGVQVQAFGRVSVYEARGQYQLIVELVQKMAQRKVSMKQIDGPIRIAQVAGEAAREEGWAPLMNLMAAISLNLGIFNLLPIPILDGGLILLTLIESVIRRDIDQRIKERIGL